MKGRNTAIVLCSAALIVLGLVAYLQYMTFQKNRNLSKFCEVTTSFRNSVPNDFPAAVKDLQLPDDSADLSIPRFTWWPRETTVEWIEYRFDAPRAVRRSAVYWFDDRGEGECRVPKKWELRYQEDGEWIPVKALSAYGVERGGVNTVTFEKIETTALRLVVTPESGFSCGLFEWSVYE